ncbi:MAG: hypothetical protein LBF86_04615 [Helicobacteraceae bacterium]|nr:hypothetical protein [Helicobacteraceae bacterium]
MKSFAFEWLLGFASGAAWVATFSGAYFAFSYVYPLGLPSAICAAVIGLIPGLVVIAVLEGAKKLFEIYDEIKKQNFLLETIAKELNSRSE